MTELFLHGLITGAIHIFEGIVRDFRFLRCKVFRRNQEIRVAFSALLKVMDENGDFLLVRNLHRPTTYSPIGGVYKSHRSAQPFLEKVKFRPDVFHPAKDSSRDIRGFIPRKNAAKFRRWFLHKEERESATECLHREIEEESMEVKLRKAVPKTLEFRHVRTIEEGPEEVEGQSYQQYRIFHIYEPIIGQSKQIKASTFYANLIGHSARSNALILVNSSQILAGKIDEESDVGHPATYLIRDKRLHKESPAPGSNGN